MEATKKKKPHLTEICPCRWAKLLTPDTKFSDDGEYSVHLLMTPAQEKALKDSLRQEILSLQELAVKGNPKFKGAKMSWPSKPDTDEDDNPTGFVGVIFKQKVKPGYDFSVQVFDAARQPWPPKLLIGNGSKIRISFSLRVVPNGFNSTLQICLHPQAVQVVDLVKYERDFGFGEVDGGYVASPGLPSIPMGSEYQGESEGAGEVPPDDLSIPF